MNVSVLTALLALCLLACATNANFKSIDVDAAEGSGAELADSTAATEPAEESTESPTEVPGTTVAPDDSDPAIVEIDEVRKYVREVVSMVENMMLSVVDTLSQGKVVENGPIRHSAADLVGVH